MTNPVTYVIAGFDWFGNSSRAVFAAGCVVMAVLITLRVADRGATDMPAPAGAFLTVMMAILCVPFLGHAMRRLNDLGWSGWWFWVFVVPVAGLILAAVLCLKPGGRRGRNVGSGLRYIGMMAAACLALFVASRLFWEPYAVISGAMKPTLLIGDLVMAAHASTTLERGEVVVFHDPDDGRDVVSRLIGLPGDRIQMADGVLHINNVPVTVAADGDFVETYAPQGPLRALPACANGAVGFGADCRKDRARETLPDGVTHDILNIGTRALDNTGVYVVPANHAFVMGDNRDNSHDSRVPQSAGGMGFVPLGNIAWQVDRVLLSAGGASLLAFWTWRPDRFFKVIS